MRAKPSRPKVVVSSLLIAGLASGCPEEPPEEVEHGIVRLKLLRSLSEANSPYVGTSQIQVTLLYMECLKNFYTANPDYTQTGPEGALIFGTMEDGGEGWVDRLCSNRPGEVSCTVASFDQELSVAQQLTVLYNVEGDLEDRELPFGPIPDAGLAGCEANGQPIVRVGSNGAVRGIDGGGDTVWRTESFSPDEAFTDQGAAIEIRAGRPE